MLGLWLTNPLAPDASQLGIPARCLDGGLGLGIVNVVPLQNSTALMLAIAHSKLTLFLTFDMRVMTKSLISRLCLYPSYLLKSDFMIIDFFVSLFFLNLKKSISLEYFRRTGLSRTSYLAVRDAPLHQLCSLFSKLFTSLTPPPSVMW